MLSMRWRTLWLNCLLALAALWFTQAVVAANRAEKGDAKQPLFARVDGTTALENERVVVQRFIIQPGQSTGPEVHGPRQLLVFVKGGVLTSNTTERSSFWPDGRVVWLDESARDQGETNTGHGPIELLWIVLKPSAAPAGASVSTKPAWGYLNYPNVPGEDVLENSWVIVQRFKMKPGEWEGVHAHNPNTFYIFIKGGKWVSKSQTHPAGVAGSATDGTIAWMDTIGLSEQHQSGNTGSNETEVVWVTLKQ
jgi:hypothetical protein